MITGANIATIVLMLLVGYSDRLNPVDFPRLSNIGLTFPLFLIINFGFLVFWLIFKKRWALIPIAGFLIGYSPIRTYCPLNLPKSASDSTLKVLSFNVYFAYERAKDDTKERVLDYLRKENADIVCLQEIYFKKEDDQVISAMYPYVSSRYGSGGTDYITILSRHPILKCEDVPEGIKKGRHSTAVFIDIDGDTVIVINNHLAST
ncbi:MAG: endonuclease/exonuclease/phosphatase family protein, partial [Prevotella sp.]|nr:endonuclease/exonuclease/phosphatase family protein [Prevotella sp.]